MSKQENFGIFLFDVKLEFHKLFSRVFVFLNGERVLKQRQVFLKGGLIFKFIIWPCLKRTGNDQIQEPDWLKLILTAV